MSEEAVDRVKKEIRKMKMMSPMSAEATVVRNYIDWILDLPWREYTEDNMDLERCKKILDEDHYGLKEPKERILEYLAVRSLKGKEQNRGPSCAWSDRRALERRRLVKHRPGNGAQYVRVSLGGVRDEAEIRGIGGPTSARFRENYPDDEESRIGNPVFLLDEVDKMAMDFRGDPSAALLEVLDPEQNSNFQDHYLDLEYDLSRVMFITTANFMHRIPPPLLDRMEIIELPGYTEDEKLHIAKQFLTRSRRKKTG